VTKIDKKNAPTLRFPEFTDAWKLRKLGDISKVIDPHPSHRAPAAVEDGIPFIGIGDVNEIGNINYKTARIVDEKIFDEHHNRYNLSIPSIGIGRVASLGKVIRLRGDIGKYAVSPTMSVIQFTNNNDLDFLYYNMNTPIFQKQFKSFSNGSTRQSVGIQDLRILIVSLPIDIEEQKKIGSFFKQLDATITLYQSKLDLLKEQKKGFLQKMFPKSGEKVPELRFENFTGYWEQRKLSNIADRFDNLRVPITASDRISGDTPYYGANGIQDYVEGFTHDGEFILVAEDGANDLKHYPVQYVNGRVWVNNHAHVIQGKKTITDNKFLMNSIKNFNIEPFLVGGGRAKLNADVMMKLNILLPSFNEQEKIGSFFKQLDDTIALHQRKLDLLMEQKKAFLQQMFI